MARSLQAAVKMRSEYGPMVAKNCLKLNSCKIMSITWRLVTVLSSWPTAKASFQAGQMAESEASSHKAVNYTGSFKTHILIAKMHLEA